MGKGGGGETVLSTKDACSRSTNRVSIVPSRIKIFVAPRTTQPLPAAPPRPPHSAPPTSVVPRSMMLHEPSLSPATSLSQVGAQSSEYTPEERPSILCVGAPVLRS